MDERALAFLKTHTDTLMVLDAKEYGMEAVPASVRAYLDPVLSYAMKLRGCVLHAARCLITIPISVAIWVLSSTRRSKGHGI